MPKIYARNDHASEIYTVTTTAATQYDLYPNGGDATIVCNDEAYDATKTQLSGFAGVSYRPYADMSPNYLRTISPSSISGATHDWAPTGWVDGEADTILFAATGVLPSLTGLAGGVHGRQVLLINVGGVALSVSHQDGNSSAANRIALIAPVLGVLGIPVDGAMRLMYLGGGVNRWRQIQ